MERRKFSVSEMEELVEKFNLLSLPNTGRAIQYRAVKEEWIYEEVHSRGGKNGLKRIYPLPSYVIEELKGKGLLDLIEKDEGSSIEATTAKGGAAVVERYKQPNINTSYSETPAGLWEPRSIYVTDPIPDGMTGLVQGYADWALQQDTGAIVPVRYHVNVFGSAGNGLVAWDAAETEAMWFRASFFKHLGINPNRCFCTRVKGDSMFPTLIDLGTALWYATARYTEEGIYLFRQYDEIRIKRLQRLNAHTFRVISDNANKSIYPTSDLDLSESDPHDFEILGRYLWSCGISK